MSVAEKAAADAAAKEAETSPPGAAEGQAEAEKPKAAAEESGKAANIEDPASSSQSTVRLAPFGPPVKNAGAAAAAKRPSKPTKISKVQPDIEMA